MGGRALLCLVICLSFSACAGVRHDGTWDGEVRVHGTLHGMLQEGKTGPVVRLNEILPDPTSVAVGALTDLSGEVTVVSGKVSLSYGEEGSARTETSTRTDAAAALLVAARVPAWRGVATTRAIAFDKLDAEIGKLAAAAGMDLEARFPFLLEGRFRELEWHVLKGGAKGGGTSHEDHLAGSSQFRLDRASATLVGFYSNKDEGVFTHMGSKTHLHCIVPDPLSSGHVDHVIVPEGTMVRFPVATP